MRAEKFLALALVGGCTWVSDSDIENRRSAMDDDQDGYPASTDCNDNDPAVSPGATEIWYDGIDGDCGNDDDFDADGDGFVMDEFAGFQTNGVEGSGELESGDCDESDGQIYPGADDPWYDGVDSDCQGNDDYDRDLDGYQITSFNPDPSNGGGDCDDLVGDVNPGIVDIWYDGVDDDCGGEDDFDVDGDGHASASVIYGPTLYVEDSTILSASDCNDENADINPSVVDVWYDGIDADCGFDDDFDADGDGFVPSVYASFVTNGLCHITDPITEEMTATEFECVESIDCEDGSENIWSCIGLEDSGSLPGGDCDDENFEANPQALESLNDAVDLDCDGGGDTFALGDISEFALNLDSFDWVQPYRPRFASNSSQVFLSVVMEEGTSVKASGVTTNFYDSAIAFGLNIDDLRGGIVDILEWQRTHEDSGVYYMGGGHDFVATDDVVYGATALQWLDSSNRALLLTRYDLATSSRIPMLYLEDALGPGTGSEIEDLDIELDPDGNVHVISCESGDGVGLYVQGNPTDLGAGTLTSEMEVEQLHMSTCSLHFDGDFGEIYGYRSQVAGTCTSDGTPTSQSCTTVSECEDGSGVVWTCEGAAVEGLSGIDFDRTLTAPVFTLFDNGSTYQPDQLVSIDSTDGPRLVFVDANIEALVVIDPNGNEWVESLPGAPGSLHVVEDETEGSDGIVASVVMESGEIRIFSGVPSEGLESMILSPPFDVIDAAAWFDPSGELILVTATSTTGVYFGMAYR